MNLYTMLAARAREGKPVRVGLIGAGKFGTMFLAQARRTPGFHILGIAEIAPDRARQNCLTTGWNDDRIGARSFEEALSNGTTCITDNAADLINADGLEVLIEATGNSTAGIRHCLLGIEYGRHTIMVNVEADAVAGPILAKRAQAAGLVYSLAWGDQPALICEHVDWARTSGFEVVCAGKGTRYHPEYHRSTPETVWENYHVSREEAKIGAMNAKMFNSFIDGTKSAIEMNAVCNATGLRPQPDGLKFPPASCWELAEVCKPAAVGGTLDCTGTTEVVSSLHRDMSPVENDLMMGTYVVIETENDYVRRCFAEYRMLPDSSRKYAALFRPVHMIGLELGISVASVALRGEATGAPTGFRSDVVAIAKKDLRTGEVLDGEGGYCAWGKQIPAKKSMDMCALPIGLAHNVRLKHNVTEGEQLLWYDVDYNENNEAITVRREMESAFRSGQL